MDDATSQMLRSSVGQVLRGDGERRLSDRLGDLGWDEVIADDFQGATAILFEEKGAMLGGGDALGPLLTRLLSGPLEDGGLGSASMILPLALHPDHPSTVVKSGKLDVRGIALSCPCGGSSVTPVRDDRGSITLGRIGPDVTWECARIEGTDPDLGLRRVAAVVPAAHAELADPTVAAPAWNAAVAGGRWALSLELVAIGRTVVRDAVDYTSVRKQYGRPIGTFQALQHRLASAYASVVGAHRVGLEAADTGSEWAAVVAKALAGRAAESACTQAQQSYGAVGFTWEHRFHRYLRRTYLLDRLLGDWRTLESEIGAAVMRQAQAPRIGVL